MNKMDVDLTLKDIVDFLYPIGSLYYTQDSNFNPNTHFGGTWVQIKDKFILACGDTYKINQTGGEASHVLIEEELPRISGSFGFQSYGNSLGIVNETNGVFSMEQPSSNAWNPTGDLNGESGTARIVSMNFGNNQAHNNLPPYETAFIWKRTGE